MERGIFTLIAPTSDPSYDTFAAYSNMFQMPLVSPAFPQQTSNDRPAHLGISLRPRYLKAVVDIMNYYKWRTLIYLYDSDNGKLYASFILLLLASVNEITGMCGNLSLNYYRNNLFALCSC